MTSIAARPVWAEPGLPAGDPAADLGEVAGFVYRQGLGKNLVQRQQPIDDDELTASTAPPLRARGAMGVPLPLGGTALLAVDYPGGRPVAPAPQLLGQLLVAALGLHRREHSHRYPDHRAIASGRAKYPVHALVLDERELRYFDVYRHALVDVAGVAIPAELSPRPGSVTVILAGRYQDLPTGYQQARASITEAELGIAMRSIAVTAQLYGVPVHSRLDGELIRQAARLLAGTGPGTWSAPVVLTLDGVSPSGSEPLTGRPPSAQSFRDVDRQLELPDPSAAEASRISGTRLARPRSDHPADRSALLGIPGARPAAGSPGCCPRRDWAEVFADRSAGRVAGRRNGYVLRPHRLPAGCLTDLLAWTTMAPAEPELAALGCRINLRVAMQRVDGHAAGLHRWQQGELHTEFTDPALVRLLEQRGGQRSSQVTEIGLRHANLVWLFSADLDALLTEFGPAAWTLSQLYCGWAMHGLGIAAAAHGLISRPSRSYDEPTMQQTLRLPREEVPMFIAICGRSAFDEPSLDLRP